MTKMLQTIFKFEIVSVNETYQKLQRNATKNQTLFNKI